MKITLPTFLAFLLLQGVVLLQPTTANAQSRQISGTITMGQKNEALPGASIYQRGSTRGTMSDAAGHFEFLASDTAVLVFSAIGFIRQEIRVGTRDIINVTMVEDVTVLEEVIAVGYGEQKRSNVTGALSTVKVADIVNKTQLRLDQALQGMVAGVNVTRNGGAPGAAPTIHIRGVGSIGNTDPLWIIDGVRMEPGNSFDVNDVETMEVLKDAASSAIYGVRGANGVILVKTKRGKGDLQVTFKSSIGQRQPLKFPDLLRSADYVKYKKISRLAAGQNPDPSWDTYSADTDWIKEFYGGSGILQSYNVGVAKGDEKFNFYMSLGHDNEKGILIDNSYKRYSVRINTDMKLTKWMKVGESTILSRVTENPISNFNENYSGGIPYRSTPLMPVHDPNNPYGGWGTAPVYFQGPNPTASQMQQHETKTSNRVDGNLYLELTPFRGFTLRSTAGLNYLSLLDAQFAEAFNYGSFANPQGQLVYTSADNQTIVLNTVATYERTVKKHNFKVMGGLEKTKTDVTHFNSGANQFPVDVAWSFNLATGPNTSSDKYTLADPYRILSRFGRFNYNYADKYLFEFNIRHDASPTHFTNSKTWGTFPSYSVGWRISEEEFFKPIEVINNLKLRASAGRLGSDNIPPWVFSKTYTSQFSTYSFDASGANKVKGFFISKYPNAEVHWEEVSMNNVALDVRAFNNKVSFSIDYYVKNTNGLLYGVTVPPSIGISVNNFDAVNPYKNVGTMRNTGIDIELGYTTQVGKFSLTAGGNASFLKNVMKSLDGLDNYITGGDGGPQISGMTRTQPGHPVSSFYGYKVQQMLNSASDIFAINTYSADGIYQESGTGPGDFMYKDLSGPGGAKDGKITAQYDRAYIGNPWPKMLYALNMSAVYNKIFDISIQFQGVQGVDVFNASKAYSRNFFGDSNSTTLLSEAWTEDHHTGNPRIIATDPNGNWGKPSSYFVENGSYLKLRNLQIGFNMPQSMLNKIKVKKLRLYANGNNLLTITKYSGLDPEIAGSNLGRGVDYGLYPQVRTYSAGLEVQF